MLFHGVLGSKLVLCWDKQGQQQVQNLDLSHHTLYAASSPGHNDYTPERYRHIAKKENQIDDYLK